MYMEDLIKIFPPKIYFEIVSSVCTMLSSDICQDLVRQRRHFSKDCWPDFVFQTQLRPCRLPLETRVTG